IPEGRNGCTYAHIHTWRLSSESAILPVCWQLEQLRARKVEQKLRENNMREVLEGVRTITGLNTKTRAKL
ncbi:hypothetical protein L3Q82_020000, partial [Scortum barcoo]